METDCVFYFSQTIAALLALQNKRQVAGSLFVSLIIRKQKKTPNQFETCRCGEIQENELCRLPLCASGRLSTKSKLNNNN